MVTSFIYPTYEGPPPSICPYCGPDGDGLYNLYDGLYTISCIQCGAKWQSQCGITWVEMPTVKWSQENSDGTNSYNRQ